MTAESFIPGTLIPQQDGITIAGSVVCNGYPPIYLFFKCIYSLYVELLLMTAR